MLLSVADRVGILNILPKEGNVVTLRVIQELQHELSFTEGEIKDIELEQEGSQVSWKREVNKEVEIGEAAHKIIAGQLRMLDKENKLPMSFMDIYERFVEGKDE